VSDESASGTGGEYRDCPSAELLVEFARGGTGLPAATREVISTHARGCEECGQVLAAFTRGPAAASGRGSGTLKLAPGDPRLAPPGAHATAAAPGIRTGDVLAGKYRVERVIGLGGMGVVVAATHLQLGQQVALKLMLPHAFQSPDATARFLREARAAAQIQGEHVASVRDIGTLESGAPFIVMELLRGQDLSDVLKTRGGLPPEEAIDYVLQACEALAEAHGTGIVHRDLKPANLFLAERPDGSTTIKVLDFGISKSRDSVDDPNLTHSKSVMGTPRYMSPEQMRSTKSVGPPTDVWALGCILYELLSARPAFDGETTQGIAIAIAQDPAPSVRETRPEVPAGLEQVLHRCLEKDPARRIGSIAELAQKLAPFASPAAGVSLERIARLAKRSERAPGQSIAFAATVASAPPPPHVAMTDPGFARSNPEAALPKSRVPLALILGGATVIGLAGAVLILPMLQPRGPASGGATTSRSDPTSSVTTASAAPAAAAPGMAPSAPASTTTSPGWTPVATPSVASASQPSARAPAARPTRPAKPTRPASTTAPVTDTSANELLDRK